MATADAEAARDADIYNEDVIAYDRETLRDYTKEGSGITFDQSAAALRRQQEREEPTIRFDQAAPSASASNPQSAYPQSGGDYDDDESSDDGSSGDFASPSGSTEGLAAGSSTSSPMDADDSEGPRLPAEEEGAESPQLAMPATLAPSPDSASVRVAESGEYRPSFLGGYVPTAREVANTPLPPTIKFNQIQRNRSSPTFPLTSGEKLRRVLAELKSSFATINAGSPDRIQAVSWILPLTSDPEQRAIGGLASMWFATLAFQYKSQLRPDDVRDNVYNGKYLRDQWAMFRLQTNAYAKLVDREMTAWFNGIVQETISDAAVEGEPSRDANSNNANRVHRALLDFSTIFETNAELAAVRQQRDEFQRLFTLQRAENERFRKAPDFMDVNTPNDLSSPPVPSPSASTTVVSTTVTTPALDRLDIAALSQNPYMTAMRAARFTRVPEIASPGPIPPSSKTPEPVVVPSSPQPDIDTAVRSLLYSSDAMRNLRRERFTRIPPPPAPVEILPNPAPPTVPAPVVVAPPEFALPAGFLLSPAEMLSLRKLRFTRIPPLPTPPPVTTLPVPAPTPASPTVPVVPFSLDARFTTNDNMLNMRRSRFTYIPVAVLPAPPAPTPAPVPVSTPEPAPVDLGQIAGLASNPFMQRMRELRFTKFPEPVARPPPAQVPVVKQAPATILVPAVTPIDVEKLTNNPYLASWRKARFTRIPPPPVQQPAAFVPPPSPKLPASPVLPPTAPQLDLGMMAEFLGNGEQRRAMRQSRFTRIAIQPTPTLPEPPRQKQAARAKPQPTTGDLGVDPRRISDFAAPASLLAMRTLRFTSVKSYALQNPMFPLMPSTLPAVQPSVIFGAPPTPPPPTPAPPSAPATKELDPRLFPNEDYLRELIRNMRADV